MLKTDAFPLLMFKKNVCFIYFIKGCRHYFFFNMAESKDRLEGEGGCIRAGWQTHFRSRPGLGLKNSTLIRTGSVVLRQLPLISPACYRVSSVSTITAAQKSSYSHYKFSFLLRRLLNVTFMTISSKITVRLLESCDERLKKGNKLLAEIVLGAPASFFSHE